MSAKIRALTREGRFSVISDQMYKNALEPEWEATFESSSYGFRPALSVNDAINRIYVSLNKEGSRKWVIDADISQCFDNISHEFLLERIQHFPAPLTGPRRGSPSGGRQHDQKMA